MDQKQSYHTLDRRAKIKYYLKIFFDIFDISINNACMIYNQIISEKHISDTKEISLFEYKQEVARLLISGFTSRVRNIPHSKPSASKTKSTHIIEKTNDRKRCFQCSKVKKDMKTNTKCNTCNVYLCFTNNRNCFMEYHN